VYDVFERGVVPSDWLEFEIKEKIAQTQQEKSQAPEQEPEQKTEPEPEPTEEDDKEKPEKSFFEITIGYDYSPIVALINGFQSDETVVSFQPVSMGIKLSALLFQPHKGKIGFELAPSMALLDADVGPSIVNSVLFSFAINFLYQYMITSTKSVNGRFGVGGAVFYNFYFKSKEANAISHLNNYASLLCSCAASFQNYFNKTLYIEGGFEYKFLLFSNSLFHFISPVVSIGAKF
jgi:hypothetical protein